MKNQAFEYVRLVGTERRVGPTLESVSHHWKQGRESFLFVSPHDDDVVIGGGLMIHSLVKAGLPVDVIIVTDGAQGYCSMDEKETIAAIRREETYASCKVLGLKKKNVHFLDFPDCQLSNFRGRRPVIEEDPAHLNLEGYVGLQNSITAKLREIRPYQVFVPTPTDLHPDHRIVYSELLISCFHASGAIWPELGRPLSRMPYLHELAIYCNFPSPPKLRLTSSMKGFEKKINAIRCFKSQKQIEQLVRHVSQAGPMEYYRPVELELYQPTVYKDMFEAQPRLHHLFE